MTTTAVATGDRMSILRTTSRPDALETDAERDRGAILVFVLVAGIIASLFVVPILVYLTPVPRAGAIPVDKSESIDVADGGLWVALSYQGDLFVSCVGGELDSSITDVRTTCSILSQVPQFDFADVPYDVATIGAGQSVPAALGAADPYPNAATSDVPEAWVAAVTNTTEGSAGQVWLPDLPVRLTSSANRDQLLPDGAQDPSYTERCRVFFPGSFDEQIILEGPTYFTSGVYSFTQPIIVRNGADVVIGTGTELGCATDQIAASEASPQPAPLNITGWGATFVFGDEARLEIDDDGSGPIRFIMNQRYVPSTEPGAIASNGVSIMTVNGSTTNPGDPLVVPGVLMVPASQIGVDGTPATAAGYETTTVTPERRVPDAPVITATSTYRRQGGGAEGPPGRITVFWDEPATNGAPITGYIATDATSGRSCSPATGPDRIVQTSCTIDRLPNQTSLGADPWITVVAINEVGVSTPSEPVIADPVTFGSFGVPQVQPAGAPAPIAATVHDDGVEVSWTPPVDDGGSPIAGYQAVVTDIDSGSFTFCTSWWNETSCIVGLPAGSDDDDDDDDGDDDDDDDDDDGDDDDRKYSVTVVALHAEGPDATAVFAGVPATLDTDAVTIADGSTAPVLTPEAPTIEDVTPILDLTVDGTARVDIRIAGYIAVPSGRILISGGNPTTTTVALTGGVVAATIDVDAAASPALEVRYDNPIGQKRIRIESVADLDYTATATAVVQVNRSGTVAINSWIVE